MRLDERVVGGFIRRDEPEITSAGSDNDDQRDNQQDHAQSGLGQIGIRRRGNLPFAIAFWRLLRGVMIGRAWRRLRSHRIVAIVRIHTAFFAGLTGCGVHFFYWGRKSGMWDDRRERLTVIWKARLLCWQCQQLWRGDFHQRNKAKLERTEFHAKIQDRDYRPR